MLFLELGNMFQIVSSFFSSLFLEIFHLHCPLLLCSLGLGLFVHQKINILSSVLGFHPKQSFWVSISSRIQPAPPISSPLEATFDASSLPQRVWAESPPRVPAKSWEQLSTEVAFEVAVAMDTGMPTLEYTSALHQSENFKIGLILSDWNKDYKPSWYEKVTSVWCRFFRYRINKFKHTSYMYI